MRRQRVPSLLLLAALAACTQPADVEPDGGTQGATSSSNSAPVTSGTSLQAGSSASNGTTSAAQSSALPASSAMVESSSTPASSNAGATSSASGTSTGCALTDNTSPTDSISPSGCAVLARDTSACVAARTAQGLSGYWLKFSCRVTLTNLSGQGSDAVTAAADGQPDHLSNYFPAANTCRETYTGGMQNPALIAPQNFLLTFPLSPDTSTRPFTGAVVGLMLNGVPIFGNFAAPGDDIFREALTFDRCAGHPQMTGMYHSHSEPWSITNDDANFLGVMRDGYPIYGRRDADGTVPTLDANGGHSSVTSDSPTTATYHYHVNQQTSTTAGTTGQMQWFITKGAYRGSPGPCTGCN